MPRAFPPANRREERVSIQQYLRGILFAAQTPSYASSTSTEYRTPDERGNAELLDCFVDIVSPNHRI